jgi:hypothetical protein
MPAIASNLVFATGGFFKRAIKGNIRLDFRYIKKFLNIFCFYPESKKLTIPVKVVLSLCRKIP